MTHTKRSPEFLIKVRRLREKLIAGTLDAEEKSEIAHILEFNTTDSGCIVRASENEPIFTLRGKDKVAPIAVSSWVEESKRAELHHDKVDDALDCAAEMIMFAGLTPPDRHLGSVE